MQGLPVRRRSLHALLPRDWNHTLPCDGGHHLIVYRHKTKVTQAAFYAPYRASATQYLRGADIRSSYRIHRCACAEVRSSVRVEKARLSLTRPKRKTPKKQVSLLPDGIYDRDITIPARIANISNNCHASSVLQCIFNHCVF